MNTLNYLFTHWKTSAAGLVAIFLGIAFLMGRIDVKTFMSTVTMVLGGGLLAAADSNKPTGPTSAA